MELVLRELKIYHYLKRKAIRELKEKEYSKEYSKKKTQEKANEKLERLQMLEQEYETTGVKMRQVSINCVDLKVFENGKIYDLLGNERIGGNNGHGYIRIGLNGKYYLVHRIIMLAFYGECPPNKETDHINRVRHDNRLCNLRYVSRSENANNKSNSKSNKPRNKMIRFLKIMELFLPRYEEYKRQNGITAKGRIVKGYSKHTKNTYKCELTNNGKKIIIGNVPNEEQAVEAIKIFRMKVNAFNKFKNPARKS